MPKRVMALLITVGFSFAVAGCEDMRGLGDSRGLMELAVVTAPVWVPITLINKAAEERKAREAEEKLRADAANGDPKAEYEIGDQYWTGRGAPQDFAEAAKWYRKSAEQGFADAQTSLGFAYQSGQGIEQDSVQADTWYIIAASFEKSPAETIDLAIRHRDYIEPNMTPQQIAEARRRAREWKPTGPILLDMPTRVPASQ